MPGGTFRQTLRSPSARMGAWGLANSLVIPAYGVFAILVVFRAAPAEELGAYLVLQSVYLMAIQLARSLALTPLVRYFYTATHRGRVVGSATAIVLCFHAAVLGTVVLVRHELGHLLRCPPFPSLVWLLVAAVFVGVPGEVRMAVLQALHQTRQVFLINLGYHVGMVAVVAWVVAGTGQVLAVHLMEGALVGAAFSSGVGMLLRPRGASGFRVSPGELAELFRYGKYTLGTSASELALARMDVLLLSALRGPGEVARYGVAKVFVRLFDIYLHTTAVVVFPLLCRLWAQGSRERLAEFYRRALSWSVVGFAGVVGLLVVAARPMVRLFYGTKYPGADTLVAAFALTGLTIPWASLAQNVINAAGAPSFVFLVRSVVAVGYLGVAALLIHFLGAMGAVVATGTSGAALAWALARRAQRYLKPPPR